MKPILYSIIILSLSSCASINKTHQILPYENYLLYVNSLDVKNYDLSVSMLIKKNRVEFMATKNTESFNDFFPFFSSLNKVVEKEISHYEGFSGLKNCLTINGLDDKGKPVSINLELLNEKDSWKLSYVQFMYHDSKEEYPSVAVCPPNPQ